MQTHTLNNQALRKLIALLGVDATETLLEEFGGTTVYFPDMERSQRIKGLLEHERHRAEMARASLAGAPDGATQEGRCSMSQETLEFTGENLLICIDEMAGPQVAKRIQAEFAGQRFCIPRLPQSPRIELATKIFDAAIDYDIEQPQRIHFAADAFMDGRTLTAVRLKARQAYAIDSCDEHVGESVLLTLRCHQGKGVLMVLKPEVAAGLAEDLLSCASLALFQEEA